MGNVDYGASADFGGVSSFVSQIAGGAVPAGGGASLPADQTPGKKGDTLAPIVIQPSDKKKKGKTTLSYRDLRSLWIQAGGDPNLASTMAAIALAESSGRIDALNDNPKTGDYSVGPWQINYFGQLRQGRTEAYGTPEQLRKDPLANARAAVAIYNGSGLGAWSTYKSGAYKAYLRPQTPEERAAAKAAQARADLTQPGLTQAKTDLSIARSQALSEAKAARHISDPWITVESRNGRVVGLGEATGETAPGNVLTQGGVPMTKSTFDALWSAQYEGVFQKYAGRQPTPQDVVDTVQGGLTAYAVAQRLSGIDPSTGKFVGAPPTFASSPAYRSDAAAIVDRATQTLGKPPPAAYVAKAIAYGWDQAAQDANLKTLPAYRTGPVFQGQLTSNRDLYSGIYGTPDKAGTKWLSDVTTQGWTQEQVLGHLRAAPEYKYSLEAANQTADLLDALGMFVGRRSVLRPSKIPKKVAVQGGPQVQTPYAAGFGAAR